MTTTHDGILPVKNDTKLLLNAGVTLATLIYFFRISCAAALFSYVGIMPLTMSMVLSCCC